ncbi:MAG TPA: sigma-70 family RNA polymerase sigma factor [Gemmataceae bacterium]
MTPEPLRRLLGLARRAAADGPADDGQLLARFAAAGDADAFELLVWRHGGMVLGVCRRILGDEHAAEDAFQATFLALARQARSVRGCVPAWLHRVARRTALRARRQSVRASDRLRFAHADTPAAPDPITAASNRELCQVLDEELDRLPERYRRPVVLCYLEGASTAEAARRLGCPRGTVLSRLAAARAKLRARLVRRGVAPAILPPVIHGGLTDAPAALVAPAVRAAVAGTAAPRVMELCDGVLNAMFASKLKLTAAVVLTAGRIGGGAGWVALPPAGPGAALADGPPAKAGKAEPPAAADRAEEERRARAEQIDRLRNELDVAEAKLEHREAQWTKERIEARLRLAEAEERYKRLEREPVRESPQLQAAKAQVAEWRAFVADLQKRSVKLDDPGFEAHRKSVREAEEQLKPLQAEHDKRLAEAAEQILQARREMVMAEEGLSLLERRMAMQRRVATREVEELQDRLIQLRVETNRPDPGDRRVKDLERKLDDVLRELTELRRELRK